MSTRFRSVRQPSRSGCLAALVLLMAAVAGPLSAQGASGRAAGDAVAIVTHPDVSVDGLSFAQLRRVFLGEQQFWPGNQRVTLLVRAPAAFERGLVLDRIYRMNEGQFRQYWIAKMFRAEVPAGPKIVYSTEMAHELVSAIPGAVAFVPASQLRPGVKVLRIDGKLPGDAGYPLR